MQMCAWFSSRIVRPGCLIHIWLHEQKQKLIWYVKNRLHILSAAVALDRITRKYLQLNRENCQFFKVRILLFAFFLTQVLLLHFQFYYLKQWWMFEMLEHGKIKDAWWHNGLETAFWCRLNFLKSYFRSLKVMLTSMTIMVFRTRTKSRKCSDQCTVWAPSYTAIDIRKRYDCHYFNIRWDTLYTLANVS